MIQPLNNIDCKGNPSMKYTRYKMNADNEMVNNTIHDVGNSCSANNILPSTARNERISNHANAFALLVNDKNICLLKFLPFLTS